VGTVRAEREWLELAADVLRAPLTAFPEQRVAEQLHRTFEARGVTFSYGAPDTAHLYRMWPRQEQFNGHLEDIDQFTRLEAPTSHPILRFYLATLQAVPMQADDVPDRFADWRVKGAWTDRATPWGAPAQATLPMHFGPDGYRVFVLGRADPFAPDELALLELLQSLLVGLDRQTTAFGLVAPGAEPARATGLTVRELTVLGLVAEGLTAAATARRLAVTEGTVHKHLQNVYRKLGVRDRLGAVLRAQQMGVLQPQDGWAADGPGA
jgi:DNA-binding CsgD family transcriptional regulator